MNFEIELHFCPSRKCSFFHIYLNGFVSETCYFACQDTLLPLLCISKDGSTENEILVSDASITNQRSSFIFHQWQREREPRELWVYFYLKVAAFRRRCPHLEISRTLDCESVQVLIIHSETCASWAGAPWLFTYLEVCLPLGLQLQLSVQSTVHNQWRRSPLTRII